MLDRAVANRCVGSCCCCWLLSDIKRSFMFLCEIASYDLSHLLTYPESARTRRRRRRKGMVPLLSKCCRLVLAFLVLVLVIVVSSRFYVVLTEFLALDDQTTSRFGVST